MLELKIQAGAKDLALCAFGVVFFAIRTEAEFAAPIPFAAGVVLPPAGAAREGALQLFVGFAISMRRVVGGIVHRRLVPGARSLAGSRFSDLAGRWL